MPTPTLKNYVDRFQDYLITNGDSISEINANDFTTICYAFYGVNVDMSPSGAGVIKNRLCVPAENFGISGVFDNTEDEIVELTVPVKMGNVDIKFLTAEAKRLAEIIARTMKGENYDTAVSEIFDISKVIDEVEDNEEPRFKIVFLAEGDQPDESIHDDICRAVRKILPAKKWKNFSFELYFRKDVLDVCEEAGAPEFVEEATICIEPGDSNILRFDNGAGSAVVVNLMASSLKRLFLDYGKKGLFEQNLRYYVKKKDVDSPIIETVRSKRNVFWYLNNGITIICDSYKISGNTIELRKFSIINGCQTTSILGTAFASDSFEENDFPLLCRIISTGTKSDDEKTDFISDIAEAANRQKPIKDSDLIANKPEQRKLKRQLAAGGIFYRLKRGEKPAAKYKEEWQRTDSGELGQLVLSALLQLPGPARVNKSTTLKQKYDPVFKAAYPTETYRDLLLLKSFYKRWTAEEDAKEEPRRTVVADPDADTADDTAGNRHALRKNGCLEMIATFFAFAQLTLKPKEAKIICQEMDKFRANLTSSMCALEHGCFCNRSLESPQARENLYRECAVVFGRLMNSCILPAYKDRVSEPGNNPPNETNFLKSDGSHLRILAKVLSYCDENDDDAQKIFSECGMELGKKVPWVEIADALYQVRYKKLKSAKTRRRARELAYTNAQAENIAQNANDLLGRKPRKTLFDFNFSEAMVNFWGKDIKKALSGAQ